MTKEEYQQKVRGAAETFLHLAGMKKWKGENPNGSFDDFLNEDYRCDLATNTLDGLFGENDWKYAIQILEQTDTDPGHVDRGVYDGSDWKQMLMSLAYCVFELDVLEEGRTLFECNVAPTKVAHFPTTLTQLGFFPSFRLFRIPKRANNHLIKSSSMVKIMDYVVKVVFDGPVSGDDTAWIVEAQRVYSMNGTPIVGALAHCKENYGVEEA